MKQIIFLLIISGFTIFNAWYDHNKRLSKTDHLIRFLLRTFVFIFICARFIDQSQTYVYTLSQLSIYMLFAYSIFFLEFDLFINLFNHRVAIYLGTVSWFDITFKEIPILYLIIKSLAFIVAFYLIVNIKTISVYINNLI